MSRFHIEFRPGQATGTDNGNIRKLAQQIRELALTADAPSANGKRKVRLETTLKMLGGRFGSRENPALPLENQLALEVWGPSDFVLYEPINTPEGNNRLACFAYLGSYVLHYHQCVEEKWTQSDGSYIGMQWARAGGAPREIHGLAQREAYAFAASLLAPVSEIQKAIAEHGPDGFHIEFEDNLRKDVVRARAATLGLIQGAAA